MTPRFLTVADVADTLNITGTQVYSLLRSGELPALQLGGKNVWRIEADELEKYIQRMYQQTRVRIAAGDVPPED